MTRAVAKMALFKMNLNSFPMDQSLSQIINKSPDFLNSKKYFAENRISKNLDFHAILKYAIITPENGS